MFATDKLEVTGLIALKGTTDPLLLASCLRFEILKIALGFSLHIFPKKIHRVSPLI